MSLFKLTITIKVSNDVDVSPSVLFSSIEAALYKVYEMADPVKYVNMPHRDKVQSISFTITRVEVTKPEGVTVQ